MFLRTKNSHFPPLQPEHTVRNDEFQLFRIGNAGLGKPVATDIALTNVQGFTNQGAITATNNLHRQ
ncbi:hypothetical protein [Yersinia aldovae]|uniref:hypothetical protein n=1 Tax=Yersinia aldovae TaxID=29483 RepID=UPI0012E01214|nr:hypothetical protein [Yersinia aldovae]